ncbi:MAG: hypothetical protein LBS84_04035 [Clostridiales bacterium]|nr:hypothetical protein [Clostridiales bacterium]
MTRFSAALLCAVWLIACDGNGFYVTETNAMKYCYADVTGDGNEELILLTPSAETTPYGQAGSSLYILDPGKDLIGRHEIISEFDVKDMKPLTVMAGDVNRDGVKEVSLKVYKTAEYSPEYAQRPFFFNVSRGKLEAVWLGSRLARPFVDYALADLNGDGYEEIASLEMAAEGYLLAAYSWDSFGFTCYAKSDVHKNIENLYNMESPETWIKIALESISGRQ